MIDDREIVRRRDMRNAFTFTIDPADAKDFDDAISFECLTVAEGDGPTAERSYSASGLAEPAVFQIGIHIADVSYYVKPGTPTDDDAYRRGTSVYLVDRVLPMLPEQLCNDLCSLKPDEDKLCMSVIFTMDADAQVLKHKICRTVIRSNARLNYDEAFQIIQNSDNFRTKHGNDTATTRQRHDNDTVTGADFTRSIAEALTTLNNLAKKLRSDRIAHGALDIEQPEIRFNLDRNGHPTDIYFEQSNDAHHLIEEFMLLANRTVAKSVADLRSRNRSGAAPDFIYRVHDLPDSDKLEQVKEFARKMGKRATQQTIDLLTIRAQAKAVYSTHNIGHYGLAFSHYTHFTSPIRRYPDLMVHRLVDRYILTGKGPLWNREELEIICEHCSECEQEAQQAERDSVKMFQALWMADHLGEILPGHISGVTEFGLFVQLDESRCEGLIHISTLPKDSNEYTFGDSVMVQVIRADADRGQIDFILADTAQKD